MCVCKHISWSPYLTGMRAMSNGSGTQLIGLGGGGLLSGKAHKDCVCGVLSGDSL